MTCASVSCPRVINQSDLIGFMIAPLPLKIINPRGSATAVLSSSSTIVDQALAPASLSNYPPPLAAASFALLCCLASKSVCHVRTLFGFWVSGFRSHVRTSFAPSGRSTSL